MAVEGSLDLFQLPEILQIISQEQKTGILTVQGQNDIVAISFLEGRVVTADALNQTLEDDLGEVLMSQGVVSRQELDDALVEQRRTGRRLMDLLVSQGSVERREILEVLRDQTLDLLSRLLHWREGEFKFYGGDEVSYEEGFRPIQVESLLLSALGRDEVPEAAPVAEEAESEAANSVDTARDGEHLFADLDRTPLSPRRPDPSPAAGSSPLPAGGPPTPALRPKPVSVRPPTPRPKVVESTAKPGGGGASATSGRQGLGWALALLVTAGLVAVVVLRPAWILVPFPFAEDTRLTFEDTRWSVRYAKLEAALRSHVLVEGQMPEDLKELVAGGLLPQESIRGPLGQPLVYQADGVTFGFRPLGSGEDVAYVGTLQGDFLLDPELLQDQTANPVRPLVLLD